MPQRPLKLFYSYSHKDQRWLAVVRESFRALTNTQIIQEWHDGKILAGEDWSAVLEDQMESTDIFVFLVTANFIKARGCQKEVKRAQALKSQYGLLLFPILLTECAYERTGLKEQPAPGWNRPIGNLANTADLETAVSMLRTSIDRHFAAEEQDVAKGPAELIDLLPYLCDRDDQSEHAVTAVRMQHKTAAAFSGLHVPAGREFENGTEAANAVRDQKRPVVLIVHGRDRESHEGFLLRLKHRIIPDELCTGNRVPVREDDLNWTKKAESPGLLSSWLADQAQRHNNDGVILLFTTVIDYWSWPGREAFFEFLKFWANWTETIWPEAIVVTVFCKYRFNTGEDRDAREADMRQFLSGNPFKSLNGIDARILPELLPVPVGVAQEWVRVLHREGGCSEFEVPAIVDEIGAFYPDPAQLMPMAELAKKLSEIARRPVQLKKAS